jgi:hypothetical protein
LNFACKAFYAVFLSCRVRFLLRIRMAGRITPIKQCHGANVDADSVSSTNVPVDSHVGPMNAQFLGRFNRSPDIVPIVLACNCTLLLKVRIYRQTDSPILDGKLGNINPFVYETANRTARKSMKRHAAVQRSSHEPAKPATSVNYF